MIKKEKNIRRGLKMMEKSSKMKTQEENGTQGGSQLHLGALSINKIKRFLVAYERLNRACRARLDTEGDAVGVYVGRLGAIPNQSYRDELMIRLVRCREAANKFTRGAILPSDVRIITEEDISALTALSKKIVRAKDPVSRYERGERVSRIRQYGRAVYVYFSLAAITVLTIALFFAIKY